MAEKYGLWYTNVYEYPKRIPYLDVLIHLQQADGIFILGSTEPHYTPSKSYQGVLSGKPILAVLHSESTAVQVLKESRAGIVLDFNGEADVGYIERQFDKVFEEYLQFAGQFSKNTINRDLFKEYSAEAVTKKLVGLLNKVVVLS